MALWTAEDDAKLRRLTAAGFTALQIACRIGGRTRNSVIGRWHRLKIAPCHTRAESHLCQTTDKPKSAPADKPKRKIHWPSAAPVDRPRRESHTNAIPETQPQPQPLYLELLELDGDMCRWPVNDGGPFLFCGHKKAPDGPYCQHHKDMSLKKSFVDKQVSKNAA